MKQEKQIIVIAVLAALIVIGAPLYWSRGKAKGLDARTEKANQTEQALQQRIDEGKTVKKNREAYNVALANVNAAMPADNDIKGAVLALQNLAEESRVTWRSATSSDVVQTRAAPAEGAAQAAFPVGGFTLQVTLFGTVNDIFAYLEKIRTLPDRSRLFVVESINIELPSEPGRTTGELETEATLTLKSVSYGFAKVDEPGETAGQTPGADPTATTTTTTIVAPAAATTPTTAAPAPVETPAPAPAAVTEETTATTVAA